MIAIPFLFCHFGERVTSEIDTINATIYNYDWQYFTLEMKKCLIIMMQIAQKPVYVKSYARILCTHDVFKKVNSIDQSFYSSSFLMLGIILLGPQICNAGYSYFMVLLQLDA